MSGLSAARFFFRRSVPAFCLCLLAFLFAVEAKTAWYGPDAGIGSNVSAAKALPAATPKLVQHSAPTIEPSHTQFLVASLLSMALARLAANPALRGRLDWHRPVPVVSPALSSPPHFLRPPPVR
jgi:hypothetical protein